MSITKVLSDKEMSDEDKLTSVAETVSVARKAYGNEDKKIAVPRVNAAQGTMPFNMLDDDGKVVLLRYEVANIKATAVEFAEQNTGVNLNKKIEELIATNGMFTNISAGTKFEYI